MIAALLCAALVAQDQQRITIEQRALRADLAFKAIGDAFGTKLAVSAEMKSEVVLVFLPNATIDELLKLTAAGLYATCHKNDDGWILERSPDDHGALMNMLQDERKAQAKHSVSKMQPAPMIGAGDLQTLSDAFIDPRVWNLLGLESQGVELSLGTRAMSRIVPTFDPEDAAGLELGRKYVWAVGDPRFPSLPALDSAISMYREEAAMFRRVFEETSAEEKLRSEDSIIKIPLRRIFDVSNPLKTVYLTVTAEIESIDFNLMAFDDQGSEVFAKTGSIDCSARFGPMAASGVGLEQIKRSTEAMDLRRAVYSSESKNGETLRTYIAGMPQLELFAEDASQILMSLGKQTGKRVVASFSDELLEQSLGVWVDTSDFDTVHPTIEFVSALQWLAMNHRLVERDGAFHFSPRIPRPFRPVLDRDSAGKYARLAGDSDLMDLHLLLDVVAGSELTGDASIATFALYGHREEHHSRNVWRLGNGVLVLLAGLADKDLSQAQTLRGVRLISQQMGDKFVQFLRKEIIDTDTWRWFTFRLGTDLDGDEDAPIFAASTIDQVLLGQDTDRLIREATIDLRLARSAKMVAVAPTWLGLASFEPEQAADSYVTRLKRSKEQGAKFLEDLLYRMEHTVSIDAVLYIGGRRIGMDDQLVLGYDSSPSYSLDQMPTQYQESFWKEVKRIQDEGGR